MKTVYLCGPINGCTDAECKDWREFAKTRLDATIDPMVRDYRGRELETGVAAEIVENDKRDVDLADIILVNYTRPSIGTAMEILYAWERGKPVVLVCDAAAVLSPWLVYHSTTVVHSMADACAWIRAR